jgi:hypothetical protein
MRTAVAGAAGLALLVAACGPVEMPPIEDVPGRQGAGADTDAAGGDLPACPPFDAPREYDPPPEQQPATDPALTSPELIEDIDVGDHVEDDQDPVPDGAAPPADPTPINAAQRWAADNAGDHFAGVWFDNDHGAAVIAFTDDLDRYAAEIRDRFGAGWWVVHGERSVAELHDLADAVGEVTSHDVETGRPASIVGWGPREDRGVVGIDVVGGDDQALAALATQLDDPAYCFSVIDPPPEPDLDGPVITLATVSGWRDGLEVEQGALLEIADDQAVARRLVADNVPTDLDGAPDNEPWEDGRHGELGDVDLDTHVVAVWSAGRSGSCPEWVDGITTADDGVVVSTAVPTAGGCTDDFNPYRTIIAVERDLLPPADQLPADLDLGYTIDQHAVVTYPAGQGTE